VTRAVWRALAVAAALLVSGCVVPGGPVGYYGGDYYGRYGDYYGGYGDFYGWGPDYRVGPFRGGHPVFGGGGPHGFRPAGGFRSIPSLPGGRGGFAGRGGGFGGRGGGGHGGGRGGGR
jgi:hypothetical protein